MWGAGASRRGRRGASWVGDPAAAVGGGEALEALCAGGGGAGGEARRRLVAARGGGGFDWPLGGGAAAVVLVGGDDAGAFARTLAGLGATRCPQAVVVVADAPGAATRAALVARAEAAGATVLATRVACGAKAVNLGLARAMGDGVAVLRAGARVAPGWLGRLRFAGRSAAVVRAGGLVGGWPACVWVARRALDAVGGLDAVLDDGAAVADWLARLAAAGFGAVTVAVGVEGDEPGSGGASVGDAAVGGASVGGASVGEATVGEGTVGGAAVGDAAFGEAMVGGSASGDPLWIEPTPPVAARPLWRPIGAEEGFRPDVPPVGVVEAAARNVLVVPPWADAAAVAALAGRLRALPDGVAVWLRAAPGAGAAAVAALGAVDRRALVVDAALAPDREGGLYAAVDAVYVEPGWPDAARTVRRAVDAGRPVLRGAAALAAWLDDAGGAR
ncbi:MAG: hypothetical protein H6703_03580 [Myxococcales bacterium]|nr:hypothetical protein [Myxococcales bacterium]